MIVKPVSSQCLGLSPVALAVLALARGRSTWQSHQRATHFVISHGRIRQKRQEDNEPLTLSSRGCDTHLGTTPAIIRAHSQQVSWEQTEAQHV